MVTSRAEVWDDRLTLTAKRQRAEPGIVTAPQRAEALTRDDSTVTAPTVAPPAGWFPTITTAAITFPAVTRLRRRTDQPHRDRYQPSRARADRLDNHRRTSSWPRVPRRSARIAPRVVSRLIGEQFVTRGDSGSQPEV